jgi:hypothetical protein
MLLLFSVRIKIGILEIIGLVDKSLYYGSERIVKGETREKSVIETK